MEAQNIFSFYSSPIKNITPLDNIGLGEVYSKLIDSNYKEVTETLRAITDKKQQNEFKATKLDYATFSGVFTKRSSNGLLQHSNLFCIDLDDLKNVDDTKNEILKLLPPALMFLSPTAKGLKLVYKINIEVADHIKYFKAFEQFFKQQMNIDIDEKCKDIPRACFLCYDKEAYFNSEAMTIDKAFIDTFYTEDEILPRINSNKLRSEAITEHSTIMSKVTTWLNKRMSFVSGNRNQYITQLAGAYNRFGIPQYIAEDDLINYAENDFKESEIKSTVQSVYRNTSYFNTAKFELNKEASFEFKEVDTTNEPKIINPIFPINGLPEYLQEFIKEYVDVYNVPIDFIASSVLFSTALAIGDKLELKGKYDNIPLLWLAIVGNVSSGKTEPLKTCLSYFTKKDKEAFHQYKIDFSVYNAYNDLKKIDKDKAEPIAEPKYFQYLLNDYTPEALYNVHTINNRGLCIYRDELKGWLDDFGRYSKSGEQSTMLSTFYRQPMQINRASKEPIFIHKPSIFISGGIQPEILNDLAKDNRAENGFLSRFIFSYPDHSEKQPYNKKKLNADTLSNYHQFLSALDTISETVDLSLSLEAENIYSEWYDKNAIKTNDEPTGYLKGVYGKLDVISLRLAIIIHGMNIVCNRDTSTEISAISMKTAIELTEYFRATALKVFHKIFKADSPQRLNKIDVAKYCNSLGASQNEIAKALKVSQPYVNKVLKQ